MVIIDNTFLTTYHLCLCPPPLWISWRRRRHDVTPRTCQPISSKMGCRVMGGWPTKQQTLLVVMSDSGTRWPTSGLPDTKNALFNGRKILKLLFALEQTTHDAIFRTLPHLSMHHACKLVGNSLFYVYPVKDRVLTCIWIAINESVTLISSLSKMLSRILLNVHMVRIF